MQLNIYKKTSFFVNRNLEMCALLILKSEIQFLYRKEKLNTDWESEIANLVKRKVNSYY